MPKIPQVIAQAAPQGRAASAADFGAGPGMERLGQEFERGGELAAGLFEAEMTSRVSGALANATSSLNNLQLEVDANPDHNGRNDQFATGSQKIANEFRESLNYPKFQGLFDERFAGTLERGRMGVAQGVRTAQIDSSRGNVSMLIESKLDEAANTSDIATRQLLVEDAIAAVNQGVKDGLWSAAQGAELKINIENRQQTDGLLLEAQAAADDLRQSIPDPQKRVAAARSRYKGKLRSAVVALVEHQVGKDQELSDLAKSTLREQIYHEIKAGKHDAATILKFAADNGFSQLEPEALLGLVTPTSQSVKDARKFASRQIFEGLRSQAFSVGPGQEAFFGLDLYSPGPGADGEMGTEDDTPAIYTLLEQTHMDELLRIQQAGPTSKYVIHGTRSNAVLQQLLVELDKDWTPAQLSYKNDAELLERQQLIETFEDFILAKQQQEKREWLYPQEMRDIASELKREVVLDARSWTNWTEDTARVYEITPELLDPKSPQYRLGAIPAEVEDEIRQRELSPELSERIGGRATIGDAVDFESVKLVWAIRKDDLLQMRAGSLR